MKSICVFCGSNTGFSPAYVEAAQELGRILVEREIKMVYGGGNVGLMGAIADEMLHHGGEVIGVIPHFLMNKEVGHKGLTELLLVDTMHERKAIMAEMADGFIAMPGGFGTMDELNEILTWAQLGLHRNPIGILNSGQYFDPLLRMFDHMVTQGFLRAENRGLLVDDERPLSLLEKMEQYVAPDVTKWLTKGQE
ncbi:MAG: TIGR00730 family Rossman fold protein [Bacteroidia bacterium]|nr:TIGR00730 family Rossman fold protein [Bacteroidia bacterium]